MDLLIALALVLLGLVAGAASGLFGIGGGSLTVPALMFLVGLPFRDAVAASLLFMVVTAPVGVWRHARAGHVALQTALVLAVSGWGGVALGTWIGPAVSDRALALAFAALLVYSARHLVYGVLPQAHAGSWALTVAVGVGGGVVAKLFGIGGGILMVPALVFMGYRVHRAVGTSLLVVWSNAVAGSAVNLLGPSPWAIYALPIAAGALVGVRLGAEGAVKARAASLRALFAVLVVLVAVQLTRTAL